MTMAPRARLEPQHGGESEHGVGLGLRDAGEVRRDELRRCRAVRELSAVELRVAEARL